MKYPTLLFLLIFPILIFSQQIKKGESFVIEFKNPEKNLDFKIVSKKAFNEIIDVSIVDSIITDKPKKNQVMGVFADGKFGKDINSMLILISGLEKSLNYKLKIKIPEKKKFVETSTSALFKNVKSIEYWPYSIEEIEFVKFDSFSDNIKITIEEKIDSTCINNSDKDIKAGEEHFRSYLLSVIKKFKEKKFNLNEMITYEESMNFEDKSLGHFWTLGKGIYPNEKGFKFGNPISYRRIECPYFEGRINYFYTKKEREIKVVSFNWNVFKESNFGIKPEIKQGVSSKFDEKFEFILETVTRFLGDPNENITEDDGRRLIRWKSNNGIKAYLFNFSNYNEINLYIYKD